MAGFQNKLKPFSKWEWLVTFFLNTPHPSADQMSTRAPSQRNERVLFQLSATSNARFYLSACGSIRFLVQVYLRVCSPVHCFSIVLTLLGWQPTQLSHPVMQSGVASAGCLGCFGVLVFFWCDVFWCLGFRPFSAVLGCLGGSCVCFGMFRSLLRCFGVC